MTLKITLGGGQMSQRLTCWNRFTPTTQCLLLYLIHTLLSGVLEPRLLLNGKVLLISKLLSFSHLFMQLNGVHTPRLNILNLTLHLFFLCLKDRDAAAGQKGYP